MYTGIYKLNFTGTDKVYIGQALDISRRYTTHKYKLSIGKGAKKLQEGYNQYGEPSLEILVLCKKEELDKLEEEAIEIFDSVNNGFNSICSSSSPGYSQLSGEDANNSKYENSQYLEVLDLLVLEEYSHRDIAEQTQVSLSVVRSISSLYTHRWMKEVSPEKYLKLEKIYQNYSHASNNTAHSRGIKYPRLISPEGIAYEVFSLRGFAREHGLHASNVDSLIQGKLKTLKGWVVEGRKLPEYPKIVSPDGKTYSIGYGKARQFALEHGMSPGNLSQLLSGNKTSYKGWTLSK